MAEKTVKTKTRWGMVIDLKRCIGCMACVQACKMKNFTPPGIFWNRLYDYELGEYPSVSRRFLVVPCMHCKEPICVDVCPTGASTQREDGIVYVDYDKCIGCGYCIVSCPYRARTQYKEEKYYYGEPTAIEKYPYEFRADYQRFKVGTATKCTFCKDIIDSGIANGLKPGVDPQATPLCVIDCPTAARTFGNLDDPDSEVSRLIVERKGYRILPELGTEPSVWYLPA